MRAWHDLSASWDEVRRTWRDEKAEKFEILIRDIEVSAKELEALDQALRDFLDEMPN